MKRRAAIAPGRKPWQRDAPSRSDRDVTGIGDNPCATVGVPGGGLVRRAAAGGTRIDCGSGESGGVPVISSIAGTP